MSKSKKQNVETSSKLKYPDFPQPANESRINVSPCTSSNKGGTKRKAVAEKEKCQSLKKHKMNLDTSENTATQLDMQYAINLQNKSNFTSVKEERKNLMRTGPSETGIVVEMLKTLIHSPPKYQFSTAQKLHLSDISPRTDLSVVALASRVDETASKLMPADVPHLPSNSWPIMIFGDGNCLPRCGSLLAYGSEAYHLEIRLRIAIELILHRESYLDSVYLSRGLPAGEEMTPEQIAHVSESYLGQHLTPSVVAQIFSNEINQTLKKDEYMGIWQLFALSSVIGKPIFSVYPHRGNLNQRKEMHRLLLPREETIQDPAFIMWSSCREEMLPEYWIPNHFVVLLPMISSR